MKYLNKSFSVPAGGRGVTDADWLLAFPPPDLERFLAKVDRSGDCWEWTASLSTRGYGKFSVCRSRWKEAHRWIMERLYGPLPEGAFVCHRCDNKRCVNPDHLYVGDATTNGRDSAERGTSRKLFTEEEARAVRFVKALTGASNATVAEAIGTNGVTVGHMVRRVGAYIPRDNPPSEGYTGIDVPIELTPEEKARWEKELEGKTYGGKNEGPRH